MQPPEERPRGKAILGFFFTIPVIGAQQPSATEIVHIGTTPSPAIADQSAVLRIRILVCDRAGLARETLKEAQRLASFVSREAGIELFWLDGEQSSVKETDCILRMHCCFDKLNTRLHRRTVAFTPAGGRQMSKERERGNKL